MEISTEFDNIVSDIVGFCKLSRVAEDERIWGVNEDTVMYMQLKHCHRQCQVGTDKLFIVRNLSSLETESVSYHVNKNVR